MIYYVAKGGLNDMIFSLTAIFSCILSMSIFILILFWIIRKNNRLEKLGIINVYIFSIFILIRGYLPFDFYDICNIHLTKTYFSKKFIPVLQDIYATPVVMVNGKKSLSFIQLIIAIWIITCCYFGIKKIICYLSLWKSLKSASGFTSSKAEEIYKKLVSTVFPRKDKNCKIMILPTLSTPAVFGQRHPIILLSDVDYSEKELYYIFLHELLHIKHHDFIVKIFCSILSVIYWWNPLISRIFPTILTQLQELYIDYDISKSLSKEEKVSYITTIQRTIEYATYLHKKRPDFLPSFCSIIPEENIRQRLFFITQSHLKTQSKKTVPICLILLLFSLSFVFEGSSISPEDAKNTFTIEEGKKNFLILKKDGSYDCYSDGVFVTNFRYFEKDGVFATLPVYRNMQEVPR